MNSILILIISFLISLSAYAQSYSILDGNTLRPLTLTESLSSVQPGTIVILGENHGFTAHQRQQKKVIQALRKQGLRVSVGMEFFTYTQQELVDSYVAKGLEETAFLQMIGWVSPSFDFYRDQVNFPMAAQGSVTLALNAPRSITGKVAKMGLAGLSEDEKALLPPHFALGRESYRQRFLNLMPHLPNPQDGENYFAAQSIWDDTMAWKATDFILNHPDQVLVIIVGDFHVQYGGGLADRITARAPQIPLLSFSVVDTSGLTSDEIINEAQPSVMYGPRADILWLAPL